MKNRLPRASRALGKRFWCPPLAFPTNLQQMELKVNFLYRTKKKKKPFMRFYLSATFKDIRCGFAAIALNTLAELPTYHALFISESRSPLRHL